jgi:hypothetical protein
MIFWSLCAPIWFRNMKKMLLQMTSVSLQPVPSLEEFIAEFPNVMLTGKPLKRT